MREQVRGLVDRGARAFVVSLLWSFVNPAHEKAVKRIIREEYRDYHVGYLPVILSSRGRLAARRVRPLEHRDPRRLPAALDADRALRHVGQAARARLPRAVLHDPQHGRLRRPVQDDRVADLQRRADRGADRRARHRQAARRAQRRDRRRRRHVVRHRPRRRRLASATTSSTRSSTSGWSRRPCCSRCRSARAAARSRRSTTRSAAGWRSGRRAPAPIPGPVAYQLGGTEPTVTDANLVLGYLSAGRVLRRAHGARPRGRRGGDPRRRSPSRSASPRSRRRR